MSKGDVYKTAQEFVDKMDLGLLDGRVTEEVQKLTREQLEEVADILNQRWVRPQS